MITAADATAFCLAQPGATAAECRDAVRTQMVGGVYCDGRVEMKLGPNGEKLTRCIPSDVLAKKLAQWHPPPPTVSIATHGSDSTVVPIVIGVGALLLIGFIALR